MNKSIVNQSLDKAYNALKLAGIADKNDKIKKTYRGQISTFGAAVTMGSLLSAIAFFSSDGEASVERSKLMKAIIYVIGQDKVGGTDVQQLYHYAKKQNEAACKEEILNAAIALKLAMNLFTLVEGE